MPFYRRHINKSADIWPPPVARQIQAAISSLNIFPPQIGTSPGFVFVYISNKTDIRRISENTEIVFIKREPVPNHSKINNILMLCL
jgi:hypothetical protein